MRPVVYRCRESLEEGRKRAQVNHESGTPGRQVCNQLADLYDDIVNQVWQAAIEPFGDDPKVSGLCLVAHGGFGRRDLAPYSDADIMLLATRGSETIAGKIIGDLTRDLGDIGIDPGLSIRQPREACNLAWSDPVILTSLSESRLLAGSYQSYMRYFDQFRRGAMRRQKRLLKSIVQSRREERQKWGETTYMLRPNVKRSRGSLRDIQLIRWLGFIRFGETDLERLVRLGLLPEEDFRAVRKAYDFFLRLRHELHFRAKKSQDVLDRPTQLEIAEAWGYEGDEGMLPVESFMRDYFDNARNVRYASSYCVEESTTRSTLVAAFENALSRKIDPAVRMGPTLIWVTRDALDAFSRSLADVLRLMALANRHNRRIEHRTWREIRRAMQDRTVDTPDDDAIAAFMDLLSDSTRLADLLRRLHELRVIEQLIPEFKRTRGLLQFNAYHKYTVDAHSIRAVEAATNFENDTTGIGRRYRRIEDKSLLHLTLLVHDIGKGYTEDHCIVGERIAFEIAKRLKLSTEDGETLAWLVRNHLIVNVAAFRHDLNDPKIVLDFAKEVGSIRRLELLVVHTVADLIAVGPDVATDWKLNLIEDLYRRTRQYFDSGSLPGSPDDPEIEKKRVRLEASLKRLSAPEVCFESLDTMPLTLLSRNDPDHLARMWIDLFRHLEGGSATMCRGQFDPSIRGVHYTVLRRENANAVGSFARSAGVLAVVGLEIRRAQIERVDRFAWNDFWVIDPDFKDGEVPVSRIEEVSRKMESLMDDLDKPLPPPRRVWSAVSRESDTVNLLPVKVTFDNDTIDRYTILSLFAYDRPGLLYQVTDAIARQRVVLHFAKIDTHLDQVADVFYVSEVDGSRILDHKRQQDVRQSILNVLDATSKASP
jgi:[protein-PII] uridylyltransferase